MRTNDVRVEIYRSFIARSRPPEPSEIAEQLGLTSEEVASAMRELARDDVVAFSPGTERLWLAHPFCADEGPFKATAAGRTWDAICIWDALGILALIEADGEVSTQCPDCSERLTVAVSDGKVQAPAGAIVHFGVPARRWYEDVGFT